MAMIACCAWARAAEAETVEVAGQSVALISVDEETRAGGLGFVLKIGRNLGLDLAPLPIQLRVEGRAGTLAGAGLVWLAQAGVTARFTSFASWQPQAGLSLLVLGGALVQTIDDEGHRASLPSSVQFGVDPLRFALTQGSVSVLGVQAGPTLFRSGNPPLSISVTLFEVGRSF